jgi:hypothetical protein
MWHFCFAVSIIATLTNTTSETFKLKFNFLSKVAMNFFLNLGTEHLESVIYLFIYLFLWQDFSKMFEIFLFSGKKKLEKRNLSNVKTCFSRKKKSPTIHLSIFQELSKSFLMFSMKVMTMKHDSCK